MSYPINSSIPASTETYSQGREGHSIEWIIIHYTGGSGNARENCQYFSGGNRGASAHAFIDGGAEIYESVKPWDTAWAAGNWDMNTRSYNIEFCSNGEDFSEEMIKQGAWLVQKLMAENGLSASRVIRHHDAYDHGDKNSNWVGAHKSCPAPYMDGEKWRNLHARLTGDSVDNGGSDNGGTITPGADGGYTGQGFNGAYRVNVDALNVRSAPTVNSSIWAVYARDEIVNLDDWYTFADGYVWGRYTSYAGLTCYIAVGLATGKPENDDYLVRA